MTSLPARPIKISAFVNPVSVLAPLSVVVAVVLSPTSSRLPFVKVTFVVVRAWISEARTIVLPPYDSLILAVPVQETFRSPATIDESSTVSRSVVGLNTSCWLFDSVDQLYAAMFSPYIDQVAQAPL